MTKDQFLDLLQNSEKVVEGYKINWDAALEFINSPLAYSLFEKENPFVLAFKGLQTDAFQINQDHGFNETWQRAVASGDAEFINAVKGLKIGLIHGELSEALEGVRKGNPPDNHIPEFTSEEAELADAVIRIMNYASDCGARLAEAIVAKNEYNRARPFKHGGKAF